MARRRLGGTLDFALDAPLYDDSGECEVCGEPCGRAHRTCHACGVRRRELRKQFQQILAARRARYGGHLTARGLIHAWWVDSTPVLAKEK